ncbi:MAG: hypothetical protein EOP11_16975, partial [Proteobacteria bacterium]
MSLLFTLIFAASAICAPTIDLSSGGVTGLATPQGPWPSSQLMHAQPLEDELNFEKLLSLINQQGITTIEGLVAALPFQMRDSNYVAMYRSRSLQAASPTAPRILSFTPTARFILSFNGGEPSQRGHDTVEIIQFREADSRFEFRELTFSDRARPAVSEANPKKCMECHQAQNRSAVDMRPNWEPYNAWPGAFGSANGAFNQAYSFMRAGENRQEPQDAPFIAEQKEEGSMAFAFTKFAENHPRYKYLEKLRPHATSELTDRLGALNFARVMRLMRENEKVYEANRELIAGMALCSPYEVDKIMKGYEVRAPSRYAKIATTYPTSRYITSLFEGLGIDTSDWSMDFGSRGRFAAFERFGTPSVPSDQFRWAWGRGEPRAAEFRAMKCQELLKTASQKVSAYLHSGAPGSPGVEALRPKAEANAILNRCARCHTGAQPIGPAIPFDDLGALRGALARGTKNGRPLKEEIAYRTSDMATRDEQMPPAGRLSPEESTA